MYVILELLIIHKLLLVKHPNPEKQSWSSKNGFFEGFLDHNGKLSINSLWVDLPLFCYIYVVVNYSYLFVYGGILHCFLPEMILQSIFTCYWMFNSFYQEMLSHLFYNNWKPFFINGFFMCYIFIQLHFWKVHYLVDYI